MSTSVLDKKNIDNRIHLHTYLTGKSDNFLHYISQSHTSTSITANKQKNRELKMGKKELEIGIDSFYQCFVADKYQWILVWIDQHN